MEHQEWTLKSNSCYSFDPPHRANNIEAARVGPGDSNVADAEGIFTNSIHLDIEKCALCSAVKLSSGPKQPLTLAICIQDGSLHSKSLSFPCADVVLVGRAWALDDFELKYSPIRDVSACTGRLLKLLSGFMIKPDYFRS
jgi:hypothetical protein